MRKPAGRPGSCPGSLLALLLPLLAALALPPRAALAEGPEGAPPPAVSEEAVSAARAEALAKVLEGEWVGARLLCRKEEDNAVRCGKPVSFAVTFHRDGTGTSTDEHFPNSFTYRWKSKSEMVLTSVPGGEELTLFQLTIKEGFLTFQTYIYLAVQDPSLPKEANYIHYIFDVHRVE